MVNGSGRLTDSQTLTCGRRSQAIFCGRDLKKGHSSGRANYCLKLTRGPFQAALDQAEGQLAQARAVALERSIFCRKSTGYCRAVFKSPGKCCGFVRG
jgi:hypothetical protein